MAHSWYSTRELATFARLTTHMVHYLCRYGILEPSMSPTTRRGTRRRFSFTDVVLARAIAKLLAAGASVTALRHALVTLRGKLSDRPLKAIVGQTVVIVGQSVYLPQSPSAVVDLTSEGQLAFHFVLDCDGRMAEKQRAKKAVA